MIKYIIFQIKVMLALTLKCKKKVQHILYSKQTFILQNIIEQF